MRLRAAAAATLGDAATAAVGAAARCPGATTNAAGSATGAGTGLVDAVSAMRVSWTTAGDDAGGAIDVGTAIIPAARAATPAVRYGRAETVI